MNSRHWLAIVTGLAASVLVLLLGLLMPMEIRHSAPYGFSKTIDFDRGIAVDGGYVTANFGNFNRLDLDLRAYTPGTTYDLTIHIRPAGDGTAEVRAIPLSVTSDEVFNRKRAFDNPFITVHFPPIRDSAGKTYYIWLDQGPRNRDDVIALWSIKSYSRESGSAVVGAFLDGLPGDWEGRIIKTGVVAALLMFVAMVGVLVGAVVYVAARPLAPTPGQHDNLMTA